MDFLLNYTVNLIVVVFCYVGEINKLLPVKNSSVLFFCYYVATYINIFLMFIFI
jgi:hypothetical protein